MLEKNGIPVDVVPGITSALALSARLGVSLTHREHAQSVRFVTGHARTGEMPADLDWRGLADPHTTLVLYMGGRTSPSIARRLVAEGLAGTTPVVVAAGISRAQESRWLGCLDDLAAGAGPNAGGEPVLIGIGAVFAEARALPAQIPAPLRQMA